MNDVFNRVLQLVLRTGDKVIVVDPNQSKPYVMMDFDDYEKLISRSGDGSSNNVIESSLEKKIMEQIETSRASMARGQSTEPRVASALAGSDPLEPDSASPRHPTGQDPASVNIDKVRLSESVSFDKDDLKLEPLETEEHFFLEPLED